ncbi:hypothetical protein FB567DRAFT_312317 [Paraphoma chrysanthemicola]|uniref:DUF6594 domain-containing protein n=1 Tax=Paraphoma chrysanthemicola TaxID=798071 RepID=A0A8K0W104_9PLEO|nr:hypothetical protein FB567DRAFT_312317 [Paraphoma chrysanthemicola]
MCPYRVFRAVLRDRLGKCVGIAVENVRDQVLGILGNGKVGYTVLETVLIGWLPYPASLFWPNAPSCQPRATYKEHPHLTGTSRIQFRLALFNMPWPYFTARLFGHYPYRDCEVRLEQIEDHPAGYPRFSALMASHASFQLCRRFSHLRARLLLLKQDRIVVLEQQLQEIDKQEQAPLFLGSSRDDTNAERSKTLVDLDKALTDYDNFIERSTRAINSELANPRDVQSLQNWVNGNGCLSWGETEYLTHCNDLQSLADSQDSAVTRSESLVEYALVYLLKYFRNRDKYPNLSRDPEVLVSSTPFVRTLARSMVVTLSVILLALPIIICFLVTSPAARISIITVSLIVFLVILSTFVTRRTSELFIAGATYTTVLVVFVSETSLKAQ